MLRWAAVCAFLCSPVFAAAPRFWGELEPGPHSVGFRVESAAGLTLAVWYPANALATHERMKFATYLREADDLRGMLPGFARDRELLRRSLGIVMTGEAGGAPVDVLDVVLDSPMAAVREAAEKSGRFPLVLWSPRYGTTAAQSVLSEYLASHGYLVVSARRSGEQARLPFELKTPEEKRAELERMTNSMQQAYRHFRGAKNVQRDTVSVLAFSYAGEAATAFQQRTPDVKIVIGLSTNLVSDWVYRDDAQVDAAKLNVRYALLREARADRPPPTALAKMPGESWLIEFRDLAHGSFNALEGMLPSILGLKKVQPFSKASPEGKAGYEVICRTVLRFLDDTLYAAPTLASPLAGNPRVLDSLPRDAVTVIEKRAGTPITPPAPRFETVAFTTADRVKVTADFYAGGRPVILLVHQSGASRGEYRRIAPRLVALGYSVLAIDARWGVQDRWAGIRNETAATIHFADLPLEQRRQQILASTGDMTAAIEWLHTRGYDRPVVVWGSSLSANLVFDLAQRLPGDVRAVLSFSPGFYQTFDTESLNSWFSSVRQPVLIVCGWEEEATSRPVFDKVLSAERAFYRSEKGRHGSSILYDDPTSWIAVEQFLKSLPN